MAYFILKSFFLIKLSALEVFITLYKIELHKYLLKVSLLSQYFLISHLMFSLAYLNPEAQQ